LISISNVVLWNKNEQARKESAEKGTVNTAL